MNRDDGVVIVVLAIEVGGEFGALDPFGGRGDQAVDLFTRAVFIAEDLERFTRFADLALGSVEFFHVGAQIRQLLHGFLRCLGVVPKTLGANAVVEFRYGPDLAVVVKDAP